MVKTSASPTGAGKSSKKPTTKAGGPSIPRGSRTTQPTSTMFTSPIVPSPRKNNARGHSRMAKGADANGFIVSDEDDSDDAFEHVRDRSIRQGRRPLPLGPPITTDGRMEDLPELHRVSVHQFVGDAKVLDEKLRNKNGHHSKPYFTENDFREMAIRWTLTTEDMLQIPGIKGDSVKRYGNKFLGLINRYHTNYEENMAMEDNVPLDKNHQNVIDLCDDDDDIDEDEGDDDYISQGEQPSKYFRQAPHVEAFNAQMEEFARQPPKSRPQPEPTKKAARGGHKSRGRSNYKKGSRKSSGSASGSGSNSRGGRSNSGVSKPRGSRKVSGGSTRGGGSNSYQRSNIMQSFGRSNDGGGGGGGIGMMPI